MPTYSYRCSKCSHEFDETQKMADAPLETCPECGGRVSRLIRAANFSLKGPGWTTTYPK